MALICRLARSQIASKLINSEQKFLLLSRPVTIKSSTVEPLKQQTYDERNMKLGRPQSPHLTIYEFQLTSILSITHRFTGMALAGYTVGLGLAAITLPNSISHYLDALEALHIGAPVLFIGKLLITAPFSYHFWNGIRHLIWDTGSLLTIKGVYTSGYAMLIAASATTIAIACM